MMIRMLIGCVVALAVACTPDDPVSVDAPDPVGFTVETWSDWYGDSSTVVVSTDRILETVPTILVNGNVPDSAWVSPTAWQFSRLVSGTSFHYLIAFRGDTLADTLYIPKAIDSLQCNGTPLLREPQGAPIELPKVPEYILSWCRSSDADRYRVSVHAEFLPRQYLDIATADTNLVLLADTTLLADQGWNINIGVTAVIGHPRQVGAPPDNVSGDIYAYYSISGPTYSSYYYVSPY